MGHPTVPFARGGGEGAGSCSGDARRLAGPSRSPAAVTASGNWEPMAHRPVLNFQIPAPQGEARVPVTRLWVRDLSWV